LHRSPFPFLIAAAIRDVNSIELLLLDPLIKQQRDKLASADNVPQQKKSEPR
jgi:hypothetical protein